jgi:dipeptidyl aminopeptidase/acylaminoacyl peptidase
VPVSRAHEHPTVHLWIAEVGGSLRPRQLTFGDSDNRFPKWSPHRNLIAFLSDRDARGTRRLYLLDLDSGEVRDARATATQAVQSFAWSPDAAHIAFTSADDPSPQETLRQESRDDARVDGEYWRHARLRIVRIASNAVTTVVRTNRHVGAFAWSPDGTTLAYNAWQAPASEFENLPTTIERVAVSGGEPAVVCRCEAAVSDIMWSPDGTALLWVAGVSSRTPSSRAIFKVAAAGGSPEHFAFGDGNCALRLQPVSRSLDAIAVVGEGAGTQLYYVDYDQATVRLWYSALSTQGGDFIESSVVVDADAYASLALSYGAGSQPWEVWTGRATIRRAAPPVASATSHNRALTRCDFGRQELFTWTAADGLSLEGVLITPTRFSRGTPPPMVVVAHGGPYDRWGPGFHLGWLDWGQWLATDGYAVLLPNPRGGF